MKSHLSRVSFLALIAVITSCSGGDGNGQENAVDMPQSEADLLARAVDVPVISERYYVGGSAKVTVTGSFQIDEAIPINTKASYSAGDMTWLQYGDSGSELPNALVTISTYEIGINAARGKPTAVIGAENCTGSMDVAASLITGEYKCPNVTSYDPRSGQMGTVDIEIDFTAAS
jgi:hypothetical protein